MCLVETKVAVTTGFPVPSTREVLGRLGVVVTGHGLFWYADCVCVFARSWFAGQAVALLVQDWLDSRDSS